MEVGNVFYNNQNYESYTPVEKVVEILDYLNATDLARMQLVSKPFQQLAIERPKWKNVISLQAARKQLVGMSSGVQSLGTLILAKKAIAIGEVDLALKWFDEMISSVEYPLNFYSPTHTLYEILFSALHYYGRKGQLDKIDLLRKRIPESYQYLHNQFDYYAKLYGENNDTFHDLDHRGYSPIDCLELLNHFTFEEVHQKNVSISQGIYDPFKKSEVPKKHISLLLMGMNGTPPDFDPFPNECTIYRGLVLHELLIKNDLPAALDHLKIIASKDISLLSIVEMMAIITGNWETFHEKFPDQSHRHIKDVYQFLQEETTEDALSRVVRPLGDDCVHYIEHLAKRGFIDIAKQLFSFRFPDIHYIYQPLNEESIKSLILTFNDFQNVDSALKPNAHKEYREILSTRLFLETYLTGKDNRFLQELIDFFPYYRGTISKDIFDLIYCLFSSKERISSSEV